MRVLGDVVVDDKRVEEWCVQKIHGRGRRMCARGGGGISLPLLLVT